MSSAIENLVGFQAKDKPLLLFVDDDPIIVDALSVVLSSDFEIITAETRKQAKKLLLDLEQKPSLCLIDLGLPPAPHAPDEGFKLIEELLALNDNFKILVLSGQNDSTNIQHALTIGAVDFVPKPCDMNLLKSRLAHQLMMLAAEKSNTTECKTESGLIGDSKPMQTLNDLITQFADTPFPILIEGESGTGKELVARSLHYQSKRAKQPFLTINCAAFSAELLEAQLFGSAKGAFTGASQDRAGFFEDAGEGTLFLDEIGELPHALQSKLLRVLENGEFYRLGETKTRYSKARIIAASNRDLRSEINKSEFRQDLYHRLSVLTIHVPPLRDRGEDIIQLLSHFKTIYRSTNSDFQLNDSAMACLERYHFPGNIRELRNIVIRLCAKYSGALVTEGQLLQELENDTNYLQANDHLQNVSIVDSLKADGFNLDEALNNIEAEYVRYALQMSKGNLAKAARILGVNRTTLYSRLQRLQLEIETSDQ